MYKPMLPYVCILGKKFTRNYCIHQMIVFFPTSNKVEKMETFGSTQFLFVRKKNIEIYFRFPTFS
jgi:hypothetical protein